LELEGLYPFQNIRGHSLHGKWWYKIPITGYVTKCVYIKMGDESIPEEWAFFSHLKQRKRLKGKRLHSCDPDLKPGTYGYPGAADSGIIASVLAKKVNIPRKAPLLAFIFRAWYVCTFFGEEIPHLSKSSSSIKIGSCVKFFTLMAKNNKRKDIPDFAWWPAHHQTEVMLWCRNRKWFCPPGFRSILNLLNMQNRMRSLCQRSGSVRWASIWILGDEINQWYQL